MDRPIANPATEADCQMVAAVWRQHGIARATVALFMVQWLIEPVRWEAIAMGDRIRHLVGPEAVAAARRSA